MIVAMIPVMMSLRGNDARAPGRGGLFLYS
jgi:hypothetical protein